jgi:hypothetical protein
LSCFFASTLVGVVFFVALLSVGRADALGHRCHPHKRCDFKRGIARWCARYESRQPASVC